ncbi:dgpfaetke family protein [Acrodontium crateriforme]|uniref:Dgpfaetke family protein n=1 Tax=Acrodontium crateriforme TaxID=150365 RepID=A0AAQ3MAD6_9PEZI|nr:dgpfaetke family protein [Acrodontium crateriforme]
MPRFIIFVRATLESEAEIQPNADLLQAMADYNTAMVEVGIMHMAEGLHPSSRYGRRIVFHNSAEPSLSEGPFPANELVAGMWIIKVKDIDEATEWAIKAPLKEGAITEVRRIADPEDFGDAFSPGMRLREEELRTKAEALAKGK